MCNICSRVCAESVQSLWWHDLRLAKSAAGSLRVSAESQERMRESHRERLREIMRELRKTSESFRELQRASESFRAPESFRAKSFRAKLTRSLTHSLTPVNQQCSASCLSSFAIQAKSNVGGMLLIFHSQI